MKIFESQNANDTWLAQAIYYCLCDLCVPLCFKSFPEVTELSPLGVRCKRENIIIREQEEINYFVFSDPNPPTCVLCDLQQRTET